MDGDKKVSAGTVGEVWLRGPNVMKEYWGDKGKIYLPVFLETPHNFFSCDG